MSSPLTGPREFLRRYKHNWGRDGRVLWQGPWAGRAGRHFPRVGTFPHIAIDTSLKGLLKPRQALVNSAWHKPVISRTMEGLAFPGDLIICPRPGPGVGPQAALSIRSLLPPSSEAVATIVLMWTLLRTSAASLFERMCHVLEIPHHPYCRDVPLGGG